MVDRQLLGRKLAELEHRLARVRSRLPASADTFVADEDLQDLVAFNFVQAAQLALDLAAHLIADAGWEVPATAREHFEILTRHGVLESGLARDLAVLLGARNLIAHAYGNVDLTRFHAELPRALGAFEQLAVTLARGADDGRD